jgi:hypothetical protein
MSSHFSRHHLDFFSGKKGWMGKYDVGVGSWGRLLR